MREKSRRVPAAADGHRRLLPAHGSFLQNVPQSPARCPAAPSPKPCWWKRGEPPRSSEPAWFAVGLLRYLQQQQQGNVALSTRRSTLARSAQSQHGPEGFFYLQGAKNPRRGLNVPTQPKTKVWDPNAIPLAPTDGAQPFRVCYRSVRKQGDEHGATAPAHISPGLVAPEGCLPPPLNSCLFCRPL